MENESRSLPISNSILLREQKAHSDADAAYLWNRVLVLAQLCANAESTLNDLVEKIPPIEESPKPMNKAKGKAVAATEELSEDPTKTIN